jgi:hypothetical protein
MIIGLLLLSTSLVAFSKGGEKPNPEESSNLKKLVDKHMVYPVFQKENMEGTVEVSFRINKEGKLNILNIKASNPELVDYVVKKLKKIQLDQNDESIGQTIKYRFVFKKQA